MTPHDVLQIITTEDGSHSILNRALNETYHSTHGAVQESMHVFIKNGLQYFTERYKPTHINILEVGFGTGLNALLTLQQSLALSIGIHYTSIEAYPIPEETWRQLNYADSKESKNYFNKLHRSPWRNEETIESNFRLLKKNVTLEEVELISNSYDLVFFDAFAPNKQPEMWTHSILAKVAKSMKEQAVFVTYCAKGQLKRDLSSLGLIVEALPGLPGKREMVRAVKRS